MMVTNLVDPEVFIVGVGPAYWHRKFAPPSRDSNSTTDAGNLIPATRPDSKSFVVAICHTSVKVQVMARPG